MSILLKATDVTKVYKNQPKPGLDILNVLSTIDTPTGGDILINGSEITDYLCAALPCPIHTDGLYNAKGIK